MAAVRFRVGLILLLLGMGIYAATFFSCGPGAPIDATWIFVPQEGSGVIPDFEIEGITLRLDLTNSSYPALEVQLDIRANNLTRSYGVGILQPFRVGAPATALNPRGTFSRPTTSVTPSGEYFSRTRFTFNSFGSNSVILNVPVSDPITLWEFGRVETGITFGSGYGFRGFGSEVEEFMYDTTVTEILNHGFTLSVNYPTDWRLSLPETSPQPDKLFAIGKDRAASWSLNFNGVLPAYFATVDLVWSIPFWASLRDFLIFLSGVTIAFGSGIMIDTLNSVRREYPPRSR